jgi:hypothetical protein
VLWLSDLIIRSLPLNCRMYKGTPIDWALIDMAIQRGKRTVIQLYVVKCRPLWAE